MAFRRYAVRRISTRSIAKFGCVLGGLAMVLPGIICGVVTTQLLGLMGGLLEQWQAAQMDLLGLGAPVEFDFISLLGLTTLRDLVTRLNDQGWVVGLLVVLLSVLGGGLLLALIVLLIGWGYNLLAAMTGGLEVELREQDK